jgi:hypothetical protein
MEQAPSLEADISPASQEIIAFMEPESSLTSSQQPATYPYPEPDKSSPSPLTLLLQNPF